MPPPQQTRPGARGRLLRPPGVHFRKSRNLRASRRAPATPALQSILHRICSGFKNKPSCNPRGRQPVPEPPEARLPNTRARIEDTAGTRRGQGLWGSGLTLSGTGSFPQKRRGRPPPHARHTPVTSPSRAPRGGLFPCQLGRVGISAAAGHTHGAGWSRRQGRGGLGGALGRRPHGGGAPQHSWAPGRASPSPSHELPSLNAGGSVQSPGHA